MVSGSLQKKNGRYYAVLSLNFEGKHKQKWVKTGVSVGTGTKEQKKNRRTAEDSLKKIEVEYSEKPLIRPEKVLFSDYMLEWLENVRFNLQGTTYQAYSLTIRHKISPYFKAKNIRLQELQPKDIQDYYTLLQKKGLTNNTVLHYHACIRKALRDALRQGRITANPADRVDRPKIKHYSAHYYSDEQMKRLLEAVKEDPLHLVVLLTCYYGFRRSEVLGLKWDAVDFQKGTITVCKKVVNSVQDGKPGLIVSDQMKTASSRRTLPLIAEVRDALLKEQVVQAQNKLLWGESYRKEYEGFICVDGMGNLWKPNYVSQHFPLLLQKIGLPRIRFHDLRHSCASLMLAHGVSMKQIQVWLGHSTMNTTANIYAHISARQKEEAAESISAALRDN